MISINWKYAFGEILIVIIGISTAFSLSKCATNVKNNKERNKYLVNLRNNVESNKKQYLINLHSL